MSSGVEKDDDASTARVGSSSGNAPNATPPSKIITDAQARVMLIAIVVALIAAAAIVGTWWARRDGAAKVTTGASTAWFRLEQPRLSLDHGMPKLA